MARKKKLTEEEILSKIKDGTINSEQALEYLSEIGACPNLLNDDNGHWAVSFEGTQNVTYGDEPADIVTTNFIKKNDWKDTIREALIWSLEN